MWVGWGRCEGVWGVHVWAFLCRGEGECERVSDGSPTIAHHRREDEFLRLRLGTATSFARAVCGQKHGNCTCKLSTYMCTCTFLYNIHYIDRYLYMYM